MTAEDIVPEDDPAEALRMAFHYGPTGPVSAIYAWLDFIKGGDFASAWAGMDDNLRMCRAQAWLWTNRTYPDIAAISLEKEAHRLLKVPSESFLWDVFAATELDQLHGVWGHFFDALDAGTLGAASHTRVIGPDLEVVVLQDTGSTKAVVYEQETLIRDAFVFTLHMTDGGWEVAAYDDFIPEPGWPPEFERPTD